MKRRPRKFPAIFSLLMFVILAAIWLHSILADHYAAVLVLVGVQPRLALGSYRGSIGLAYVGASHLSRVEMDEDVPRWQVRWQDYDDVDWVMGSFDIDGRTRQFLGFRFERDGIDLVLLPFWFLLMLFAVLPIRWWFWLRKAKAKDLCANCGYDLRSSHDRCPECGTIK